MPFYHEKIKSRKRRGVTTTKIPAHTFTSQRRALAYRRRTGARRTPTAAELAAIEGRSQASIGVTRRSDVQPAEKNISAIERFGSAEALNRQDTLRASARVNLRQKPRETRRRARSFPEGTRETNLRFSQGILGRDIKNIRVDDKGAFYAPIEDVGIQDLGFRAKLKDEKIKGMEIALARRERKLAAIEAAGGIYSYTGEEKARKILSGEEKVVSKITGKPVGRVERYLYASGISISADILQAEKNYFDIREGGFSSKKVLKGGWDLTRDVGVGAVTGTAYIGKELIRGSYRQKSRENIANIAFGIAEEFKRGKGLRIFSELALGEAAFAGGFKILGKGAKYAAGTSIGTRLAARAEWLADPYITRIKRAGRILTKKGRLRINQERIPELYDVLDQGVARVKIGESVKYEQDIGFTLKDTRTGKTALFSEKIVTKTKPSGKFRSIVKEDYVPLETYGGRVSVDVKPSPRRYIEIKFPQKMGKKAQISIMKQRPRMRISRGAGRMDEAASGFERASFFDRTISAASPAMRSLSLRGLQGFGSFAALGLSVGAVSASARLPRTRQRQFAMTNFGQSSRIGFGLDSLFKPASKSKSRVSSILGHSSLGAAAISSALITHSVSRSRRGRGRSSSASPKTRPFTPPKPFFGGGVGAGFALSPYIKGKRGKKRSRESPSLSSLLGGFKGVRSAKLPIVTGFEVRGL